MEPLRVLELYSGVGGMHYALKGSGVPAQVVAAVDINTTANLVYRHNFPHTPLWNKTIEGISLEDFNKLAFDMILMSPPCQPFTRLGLQGDVSDARAKSFLYVLDLLPRLRPRPRYILLENVKGFESSSARDRLVDTLTRCGYAFQELMVSPTSVGIPNSRLRYFLIAKICEDSRDPAAGAQMVDPSSAERGPSCPGPSPSPSVPQEHPVLYKLETQLDVQRKRDQDQDVSLRQIQDFLEPQSDVDLEDLLLPAKTLLRYGLLLDIVQPPSRRSICFTKGYGRFVEGTGSVLQSCEGSEVQSVFSGLQQVSEEEQLQRLRKLKLRYFSPREVANLMGFPLCFSFPQHMSSLQKYRLLGNSLNVEVVCRLLQQLLSWDQPDGSRPA